jgi:Terpene synthase family 2, C-terminal metal binding
MHPEQGVQAIVYGAMNRIQLEYGDLSHSPNQLSLLDLFSSADFRFDAYCADFRPHAKIGELKRSTIHFGEQYGILLPNAEHYITCAMFLFPEAPLEKIILLSKNYAVDFYLNDTMGRDTRPSSDEKTRLNEIRDRLASIGDDLDPTEDSSFAEIANLEVLSEISKVSPKGWFNRFLKLYLYHIDTAHQPFDSLALARIQSIEEYINRRCYISGMPHSVALIEYSHDVFLDWEGLNKAGIGEDLIKANWTVSLIGALTNDLFSFEKEVIDQESDSNLVVLILLNNFRMRLEEAIRVAAMIIRDLLADYQKCVTQIDRKIRVSTEVSAETKNDLGIYMAGLKAILQACWMWQTYTERYKRINSIWKETAQRETIVN